jgi:hypothetical protein
MGQHKAGNRFWIHILIPSEDGSISSVSTKTKCGRVVKITMTTKGRQLHDDEATCPDCNPFREAELS